MTPFEIYDESISIPILWVLKRRETAVFFIDVVNGHEFIDCDGMVSDGISVLYSRASSPVDFGFDVYPCPGTVPETVFASETLSLQKRDEF